jgi:hypothetical protein
LVPGTIIHQHIAQATDRAEFVDGILDGICDVSQREKESPTEVGLKTWAFPKEGSLGTFYF